MSRSRSSSSESQAQVLNPRELPNPVNDGAQALSRREQQLIAVFQSSIARPIEVDQSFFDAGASSLGLMRFHLRVAAELGVQLSIDALFEHCTIRQLAHFLDGGSTPSSEPTFVASERAVAVSGEPARVSEPTEPIGLSKPDAADEPMSMQPGTGDQDQNRSARDSPTYRRIVRQVTSSGISQQELSAAVGTSLRSVQNWASGDAAPRGAGRDRLLDIQFMVDELRSVYTEEGIEIWLHARNRNLGGSRPIDLLTSGKVEQVLDEAQRLSGAM
jgi:DNA-binding transcriptional regulator YiaG/acyl carrier protein